jgi:hypothetical protein
MKLHRRYLQKYKRTRVKDPNACMRKLSLHFINPFPYSDEIGYLLRRLQNVTGFKVEVVPLFDNRCRIDKAVDRYSCDTVATYLDIFRFISYRSYEYSN